MVLFPVWMRWNANEDEDDDDDLSQAFRWRSVRFNDRAVKSCFRTLSMGLFFCISAVLVFSLEVWYCIDVK